MRSDSRPRSMGKGKRCSTDLQRSIGAPALAAAELWQQLQDAADAVPEAVPGAVDVEASQAIAAPNSVNSLKRRARWDGDWMEMRPILKTHLVAANVLQFDDAADGDMQRQEAVKHCKMINELNQMTSRKVINKPTMGAAPIDLAKKQFSMNKQNAIVYAKLNSPRILSMLRLVSQAVCKDPVPRWARIFADPENLAAQATKRARAAGSKDTILAALTPQPSPATGHESLETQPYDHEPLAVDSPDRQPDTAQDSAGQLVDGSSGSEVASIDGEPVDEGDIEEADALAEHAHDQPGWIFGWCPHAKKAFRHPPDEGGSREYTNKLVCGSHADAAPTAHWPDGASWAVSAITSRQIIDAPGQPGPPAESELETPAHEQLPPPQTHMTARTAIDNLPVLVKDRFDKDRPPLVAIYMSSQQVCQVPVARVGHKQAVACLVTIARQLVEGKIQKKQLYPLRNQILNLKPVRKTSKAPDPDLEVDASPAVHAPMKKPAASSSSTNAAIAHAASRHDPGEILTADREVDSDDEVPLGIFDIWPGFF